MPKTLYLLDGMALIYRAHFALIKSPIFTSKGVNTSALYGFMSMLLDLLEQRKPDLLAIALDTSEPTERHLRFPEYKAHREEIPEDIALAIPNIERVAAAMNIPVLKYPGYEADDIIGTLAVRHASDQLDVMMVTPDKDFAQLVRPHVFIMKPGRQGNPPEVLGEAEIKAKWEVPDPSLVADILGLWGDASDNIPGVPGFGEKTAKKLVAAYGPLESIYAQIESIAGKQKEKLLQYREQAFLSRDLARIQVQAPIRETPADLAVAPRQDALLKPLLIEFEFNSIGRRIYGNDFKAGRGASPAPAAPAQGELFDVADTLTKPEAITPNLKTIADTPHSYTLIERIEEIEALAETLSRQTSFCFDLETDDLETKTARIAGMAFCWSAGKACYVRFPRDETAGKHILQTLAGPLADARIEKTGHNLKFDLSVLAWHGVSVQGVLFDTMIAHALLEPERRHSMDALAEQFLGYSPIPISALIGDKKSAQITMFDVEPRQVADYAAEDADVTWQLRAALEPKLREQGQEEVFHKIEMPLLPVIVQMERRGIRLDQAALAAASNDLAHIMHELQEKIYALAGQSFNLNSPRQLGEILFDKLGLADKAKKTRTGQYATDESVLAELAGQHEIARLLLDYREASKLKSTYVDALPQCVFAGTGRIHTSFSQTGAITGRLASSNPNLQNIPIRSGLGQQIRAAFVASTSERRLLSADYSQIELRVMAELSGDPAMLEAFHSGLDIHAATAARVYQLAVDEVTPEMRRRAKMVNFGIIYGISAFGLAQRLGISRTEAAGIIQNYFERYPGVKAYMERTIATCREKGFVETLTGRRRWIRDIASANATVRGAAERTAINTPIQGTAADMIKIAMVRIEAELTARGYRTAMILQVHDELLFDLEPDEQEDVTSLVVRHMQTAIPMTVPIVVETGIGRTWLEAH